MGVKSIILTPYVPKKICYSFVIKFNALIDLSKKSVHPDKFI